MSFLRQSSPVPGESWAGSELKCPWLQGQVECTAGDPGVQDSPGGSSAQ